MSRLTRFITLAVAVPLAVWIFWLRGPSFDFAFWNLDEGIYATVGRTIAEGGVMYRDAIDHRVPVCHYLTAAVFALAGVNNVWAMHATLAGMIAATALGLFLLGRRWRGLATGLWAAAIFAALSTDLLYVGDAYAVSTEWFLILFSTWSAWWFWVNWPRAGFWPPFVAGLGYAAAFLSKQPGLLEVGAPVALLVYVASTRRLGLAPAARVLAGLVSGFITLTVLVFAYFWRHGALTDFYFYGWTYNLVYYGADTTLADRLDAALTLLRLLGTEYPLLLALIVLAALRCLHLVTRDHPSAADKTTQPSAVFLLCWLALSAAGAASAGRAHPHYYIQAMPALSLTAAWLPGTATRRSLSSGHWWLRLGAALLVLAGAWNVVTHPIKGRARPGWGADSAHGPAEFIKARSLPTDRIIVWGLYPDFYVYADRAPASRYLYTSFQTGMQPGKNNAAGVNTDSAVVPGSLDTLLRDIEAARPVFFVDTSFKAQRLFEKYPLTRFPRLEEFVLANYVEVEALPFHPHGFRVLMLKDSARRTPLPLAGGPPAGQLGEPTISGPSTTDPVPKEYEVQAAHTAGRLQRVELLVNDTPVESVSFQPAASLTPRFLLHFERLGRGRYRLAARATSASGEIRTGPELVVECSPESLSPERRAPFALPAVSRGSPPSLVRAPFGAAVEREGGAVIYFVHAPSVISYPLPAGAARLSGRFGFRPGAYAADNTGHTDGAEFSITWISTAGQRTELMRQLLRPWETPADRGEHPFACTVPAGHNGGTLELSINEGPAGNSASDWTYWADLLLTDSP